MSADGTRAPATDTPPARSSARDRFAFLTGEKLALSPHLKLGHRTFDRFAVKNVLSRRYLFVRKSDWDILSLFSKPVSVPEVLSAAIETRICPPLCEFYELVAKAQHKDILRTRDDRPAVKSASAWTPRLPGRLVRPLVLGMLVVGLGLMLFQAGGPSMTWLEALVGWFASCVALSVGYTMAASLVRHNDGEVYPPLFTHGWGFPHVTAGFTDWCLIPKSDQVTTLLAVPAALVAAAGGLSSASPGYAWIPSIVALYHLHPLKLGFVSRAIRVHTDSTPPDACFGFIFPPNQRTSERWNAFRRGLRSRGTWWRVAWGVLWALIAIRLLGTLADPAPWTRGFWEEHGVVVGAFAAWSVAGLLVTFAADEAIRFLRRAGQNVSHRSKAVRRRWKSVRDAQGLRGAFAAHLAEHPLFPEALQAERARVVAAATHTRHAPFSTVVGWEDAAPAPRMIVSGSARLYRRSASGRSVLINTLREGDILGLHPLADPANPSVRIRASTPLHLFSLPPDSLPQAGSPALALWGLRLPFVRSLRLASEWPVQAVRDFCELSQVIEYKPGDTILEQEDDIIHFLVLFEGLVNVIRRGRTVDVMRPGGHFGEIAILQNNRSPAGLRAAERTRMLCVPKADFMRFVTRNPVVALALERTCSQRLGRPIFPLSPGDFVAH